MFKSVMFRFAGVRGFKRIAITSVLLASMAAGIGIALLGWLGSLQAREFEVRSLIASVSADENAYWLLWEKLVKQQGDDDAALKHLRAWAEAHLEFKEALTEWKRGIRPRPDDPGYLAVFTTEEVKILQRCGEEIPYGCVNEYLAIGREPFVRP